jgi:hypothetical protein
MKFHLNSKLVIFFILHAPYNLDIFHLPYNVDCEQSKVIQDRFHERQWGVADPGNQYLHDSFSHLKFLKKINFQAGNEPSRIPSIKSSTDVAEVCISIIFSNNVKHLHNCFLSTQGSLMKFHIDSQAVIFFIIFKRALLFLYTIFWIKRSNMLLI